MFKTQRQQDLFFLWKCRFPFFISNIEGSSLFPLVIYLRPQHKNAKHISFLHLQFFIVISRDQISRYQKYCKYASENVVHSLCIASWHLRNMLRMRGQRNPEPATTGFLPMAGKNRMQILDQMDHIDAHRKTACAEICKDKATLISIPA